MGRANNFSSATSYSSKERVNEPHLAIYDAITSSIRENIERSSTNSGPSTDTDKKESQYLYEISAFLDRIQRIDSR